MPATRNTRALVIGRGGHIVFEKYWDDTTFDTPVELSGFTPVLVAHRRWARDERSASCRTSMRPLSNYIPGDRRRLDAARSRCASC